jgi:transcription initiation factor TFIID subunit 1
MLSESTLQPPISDDEDYDEGVKEELEKEPVVSDKKLEVQTASLSGSLLGDSFLLLFFYNRQFLINFFFV